MAAIRNSVRERYLDYMDEWEAGERHLAYTLVAVLVVLSIGAIMVPITFSADDSLPPQVEMQLAQEYVAAVSKVEGATPPDAEQVAMKLGATGGVACSKPIPQLHDGLIRRPKGRPSSLDKVAQAELRATMQVYCPKRDGSYATWLKKRSA